MSSRVRGDLKLEAHERRETRQVSPAHHPIYRSHSEFMFQSMWISRYVCNLLDGRGGDSESRETNLTIGFPVVFPPRSVAHVRATENPRPAVLGCTPPIPCAVCPLYIPCPLNLKTRIFRSC